MQKVVSTKLTEQEHQILLDRCNKEGCTPSSLIKQSIMDKIQSNETFEEDRLLSTEELEKKLGLC